MRILYFVTRPGGTAPGISVHTLESEMISNKQTQWILSPTQTAVTPLVGFIQHDPPVPHYRQTSAERSVPTTSDRTTSINPKMDVYSSRQCVTNSTIFLLCIRWTFLRLPALPDYDMSENTRFMSWISFTSLTWTLCLCLLALQHVKQTVSAFLSVRFVLNFSVPWKSHTHAFPSALAVEKTQCAAM